jgi:uncharacterized protein YbjT (DUF2867 family)
MRYRRISVIGAAGFVGRYVVKRLAGRGAVIAAIGRDAERAKFLRPMGDVGQVTPVSAPLGDEVLLRAAIHGSYAVVNLAGILYESGDQKFEAVHHEGPARLARLAKAEGVRQFVHVSALGADASSGSAYARTKAAGEAAVRREFPEAVILRPSVVFGPEDDFFNRFAEMARLSPFLPLIGGGKTKFQPVYVGDVADAVVKALDLPDAAGRTYELGGPRVYTFRELMELLLVEIHRKKRLVSMSYEWAALQARLLELLPNPPLTRDQVELLKHDNVVSAGALTLRDLGIEPTAVEVILPTYIDRFRKGGWFEAHRMAGPSA